MNLDNEREENTSHWINKQHGGKEGNEKKIDTHIFLTLWLCSHFTSQIIKTFVYDCCCFSEFKSTFHHAIRLPCRFSLFLSRSLRLSRFWFWACVCVCVCVYASARVSSNCFAPMEFNGTQTRRLKRNNCNEKRVLRWRFRIFSEWKVVIFANRYCNIEFNTTYLPYFAPQPLHATRNHIEQLQINEQFKLKYTNRLFCYAFDGFYFNSWQFVCLIKQLS